VTHVMQVLDGRLQRRVGVAVRRDAAVAMSNGRMVYDALFSRTGIQTYGDSIEYRPDSEVFAAASRKSGDGSPGVLLHPSRNFATKFDGQYSVKGCAGTIEVHTDGIHTAGKLYVWDGEWNDAIEQQTMADLSVGYTINPDRTPGDSPDGTRYHVVHRDIIWDHVAGVPAGNAGTACVVLDARSQLATRSALADIAAMRMDARPLHVDLGRTWPHREKPRMDETITTPERVEAPVVETPKPPEQAPAEPPAPDAVKQDAERQRVFDAAVADAADKRTGLLELARRAIGSDYSSRTDGKPTGTPKTDAQIKREIIAKVDASRLPRVDRYTDARDVAIALDTQLDECRAIVDAAAAKGPALLAAINQAHADRAKPTEQTPAETAMSDRLNKIAADAQRVGPAPTAST
jgi:hypothetical protein